MEEFARLRICLFCYVLAGVLSESSKTRYFDTVFYITVVNDGLHESYLLLTNRLFMLTLSESNRRRLI